MAEMAILNDVTGCMGCKACQTACKQWNELPAENTDLLTPAAIKTRQISPH